MNDQFHKLFLDEMADMLDGEQQIVKALPQLIKEATSQELNQDLTEHLSQTEDQVSRLEEAFQLLGEDPKTKPCKGLRGILSEGEDLLKEDMGPDVMDAAIIASAQRVEHYEIAAYGTLVTWAKLMDHDDVADLLSDNLDEEEKADELLSKIAQKSVNKKAEEDE